MSKTIKKTDFIAFSAVFTAAAILICLIGIRFSTAKTIAELTAEPSSSFQTIVIDAGHGGEDGGASLYGGAPEKELNLHIANDLRDILTMLGFKVIMTRTDDTLLYDKNSDYQGHKKSMDLANRLKIARETENAILLSIHMNAFPETKYSGLQVYYSKNKESSQRLALLVQDINRSVLSPENNRKIKQAGSNIFLLDRFDGTAILIECGFLSNDAERELLNTAEYRQKLSAVFLAAITEFVSDDENIIK